MSGAPTNTSAFADNDDLAEELFKKNGAKDPFPNIPTALLNSADIHDYIEKTGMVCPYQPSDKGKLKSSSLELDIGDLVIFWDSLGQYTELELAKEDTFKLEPNSVIFIKTEQKFRIPPYLAIRFNLKITNVHRGLLLGTGPLVDPGFQGHLLIPVHNLTNNTYTFKRSEGFIWVEFTKISPNSDWSRNVDRGSEQRGKYIPFPDSKMNLDVRKYLAKAAPHQSIRNAIPDTIQVIESAAKDAKAKAGNSAKSAESAKNAILRLGGAGAIAALIALVAIASASWTSTADFSDVTRQSNDLMNKLRLDQELPDRTDKIINSLLSVGAEIQKLSQELNRLKEEKADAIILAEQKAKIVELEKLVNKQAVKITKLGVQNASLKAERQIDSEPSLKSTKTPDAK